MSYNPFTPQGNTVLITAAVSPPTGVQVPSFKAATQSTQYRIKSSATADVAIGWGADATTAQTNAAIPGSAAQCLMLGAGQTEVFSFPPGTFFSAAIGAATGAVYITVGDGQ
jgi:hypothetical protein